MTTIRTIKLKKNPVNSSGLASLGDPETGEPQIEEAPPAPIGLESAAAPAAKRSTFTLFSVFGLCAMIALFVIIGLQVSEWSFYAANPSVWPLK